MTMISYSLDPLSPFRQGNLLRKTALAKRPSHAELMALAEVEPSYLQLKRSKLEHKIANCVDDKLLASSPPHAGGGPLLD